MKESDNVSKFTKAMETLINQNLMELHTAFFAKVISVSENGNEAKIQPLNMIKAVGQNPKKQAVLTAPILPSAHKHGSRTIHVGQYSFSCPTVELVCEGDTVLCICGERDITETKKGNFATPPLGHHRISDAVIVGVV